MIFITVYGGTNKYVCAYWRDIISTQFMKPRSTRKMVIIAVFVLLNMIAGINACVHAPYVLPQNQRTNAPDICFERDILPIFVSNCTRGGCHDAVSHKSGYVLDNYANIVRKGIVPGNAAASQIWESITIGRGEGGKMPVDGSLTAAQLDLIKRWIIYGAVDSGACSSNCDSNNYTYSGAIAPLMQTYCTGCHNSAAAEGGSLTDYNSVMNAAVNGNMIGSISHLPGYHPMPSASLKLSDCQIAQVKKWVAAGAPNN